MDTLEAIRGRRSVRMFKPAPVPRNILEEIIRAGIWAPSGSNLQAVRYIAVDDKDTIRKIKAVSPGMGGNDPAAVIVLCVDTELARSKGGDPARPVRIMDVAMAAQNILLAAHTYGVGTCAIASFLGPSVSLILNLPDNLSPMLLVSLGYPEVTPKPPRRKPFEEVVHWGRFSEAVPGTSEPGRGPTQPPAGNLRTIAAPDAEGNLERDLLKELCFMAVCARNCLYEPASYGPLRLIEATSDLIEIMLASGLDSHSLGEVRDIIEASKHCLTTDTERFSSMLDEVARMLTARLAGT